MRRLVWTTGVSVDGYVEGPDRDVSWHRVDEEVHRHVNAWLGTSSTSTALYVHPVVIPTCSATAWSCSATSGWGQAASRPAKG